MPKDKKEIAWFLFVYLTTIVVYTSSSVSTKMVGGMAIFYSTLLYRKANAPLLLLAESVALSGLDSSVLHLIVTLPVYLRTGIKRKIRFNIGYFLIPFLAFISYMMGIDSNINTMIMFYLCLWCYVIVSHSCISKETFLKYSVLAFFVITTILIWELRNGNVLIYSGRLAIHESIRTLANIIAIPVYATVISILTNSYKLLTRLFLLTIAAISSFILFATLSKGALIATFSGLAAAYLTMVTKRRLNITFVIAVILIMSASFNYLVSLTEFRVERLSEESGGFSGRTDIWETYWNLLKQDPGTLLFGFGPGDIKRLNVLKYYSHSLFLDVLFSYGLITFIVFVSILIRISFNVFKMREPISMGLLVFAILLYATHGVSADITFYILLASAVSISQSLTQVKGPL